MTPAQILDLIKQSPIPLSKRDLAQMLRIKGSGPRTALKHILSSLEDEGQITKHPGGAYSISDGMPAVITAQVTDISLDGDITILPIDWDTKRQGPAPIIWLAPDKKGHAPLGLGQRALVRLEKNQDPNDDADYTAHIIRSLSTEKNQIMGIFTLTRSGRAVIRPTDRKAKNDFDVPKNETGNAQDGDLVLAETAPSRGLRRKNVRVIKILGKRNDVNAISLISLHEAGLREEFPAAVLSESKNLKVPSLKGREDLRDIPLVTIDGADARDFDDAVYAEKLENGGFHLIVAIADVSYYVRHASALDDEAQNRGNSTYFPDRVVPMLPEALSNDLCSLRPKENRAAMAAHLWIDEHGKLIKYKFNRAIIKSAARLIYEQVQAAIDGQPDDTTGPLLDTVLKPLYAAYEILDKARIKRGALDLDLPERQILINDKGHMTGVKKRLRLDAHKLIEEFMVLANVAAAKALEGANTISKQGNEKCPCVYRVHDRPKMDKIDGMREFLDSFGLSLPKGNVTKAGNINQILRQSSQSDHSKLISMMILRCQSQAIYSTENIGHFGLALTHYAHFTSPIRRYADLLVHRALVSAFNMGEGGLSDNEKQRLDQIASHISTTERTSMSAERSAIDRFTSSYLANHIGAEFNGQITSVTRFGLFVELSESGADGLVPMRSLPHDYYIHDEDQHVLIGRRHKRIYRLGAPVTVTIAEADPITGSAVFALTNAHEDGADIPGYTSQKRNNNNKSRGPRSSDQNKPRRRKGKSASEKPPHKKKKQTTPKHKRKK